LTTLSGRVVSADASAERLLNCPSTLLTGSYLPIFLREPTVQDLGPRSFAGIWEPQEWPGVLKPLRQPAMSVTIHVEPSARGPRPARRGLAWKIRPQGAGRPAAATRSPLRASDTARALEEAARRLGRELHDEAGQLLATAHLALDDLECCHGCPTHERLPRVKGILDQIEHELRRLSHDLRPALLESSGLGSALRDLVDGVRGRYGLAVAVQDRLARRLAPATELHLFRIAQEAVNNAARHADARGILVRVRRNGDDIVLEVEDDGRGMPAATDAGHGLGLLTMAERAALLGGSLEVVPRPQKGTTVRVRIPCGADAACAS
jgi:signal transduction histidine kinase